MLKTIRLSKNIFSLTERLPKAQYRSPKVFSSGAIATGNSSGPAAEQQSNALLPSLTNVKNRNNNNISTIQPPASKGGKPKSRLQDDGQRYEDEEFDSEGAHRLNKGLKGQRSQKSKLQ